MVAPLISPAVLSRIRLVNERAMPSTCRVLRRSDTVSDGRVASGTETQIGPTVACRLRRGDLQPRERATIGRLGDETFGEVALSVVDQVPDVLSGDRIEVTTPAPAGDVVTTFSVMGDPWLGSYDTALNVTVQRED